MRPSCLATSRAIAHESDRYTNYTAVDSTRGRPACPRRLVCVCNRMCDTPGTFRHSPSWRPDVCPYAPNLPSSDGPMDFSASTAVVGADRLGLDPLCVRVDIGSPNFPPQGGYPRFP